MNKLMYRCLAVLSAGIFFVSVSFAEQTMEYVGYDPNVFNSSGSSTSTSTSSKGSSSDVLNETEDGGYTADALKFKGLADIVAKQASATTVALYVDQAAIKNFESAATFYNRFHGTCVSTQSKASWWCREKTSPQLQESLNQINMVAGAISGATVNDTCSIFSKAMQLGQAGLTAYTASCSAARAVCESACTTVYTNLERLKKTNFEKLKCNLSGRTNNLSAELCTQLDVAVNNASTSFQNEIVKDLNISDPKSIALKHKACTYQYTSMIASAGIGLMSMVNSLKQGQKCDDESSATGVQKTQTLAEKCAIEANAQMPDCICLKNPMLEGCSSTAVKSTTSAGNISSVGAPTGDSKPKSNGLSGSDLAMDHGLGGGAETKGNTATGAPAPTGGGGSAGLGGSGGGSGGDRDPANDKSGQKGLNTNILSGAGGGGGGGGGSWGAGGGIDSGKGYRSYLPGGDKDPNKMAGQQSWSKEVTGQGGKSNWEKVKDRYRDNKNSLLSN